MIEQLLKEIAEKRAQEVNAKKAEVKANMVEEMKKFTLKENIKRIVGSLAAVGMERSLKAMLHTSEADERQRAFDMGGLSILTSVCESLQAALDHSKTSND